ncbi:phage tail assembly chaperone [Rhizobium sp. SL42]|uniref:phage tail assembly chaperone n=1 Tax=Rhizobium sp. SL42 TaxID=2806346 RepID=UPI001F24BEB1|nr:phage tail assembly chaperone [Rhizobium sp. SL42]UJW76553.1 phage tail assembly chaperone [Rhizobium sp. SL42]
MAAGDETTGAPRPFPWDMAMAVGLGRLRLEPSVFWALTMREFAAAAGLIGEGGGALTRPVLAGLMQRFPDQ